MVHGMSTHAYTEVLIISILSNRVTFKLDSDQSEILFTAQTKVVGTELIKANPYTFLFI